MSGHVTRQESSEACGCAFLVGVAVGLCIAIAAMGWAGLSA